MELLFGQSGPDDTAFDRMLTVAERKYDADLTVAERGDGRIASTTVIRDDGLIIGLNGRIDSHAEAELPSLYQDHGIGFLRQLQGHFRLAVLTEDQRYLATDHVGSKPLYRMKQPSAFSSHLVPLMAADGSPSLDEERLRQVLINGFTLTTGPRTLVDGIRKLLPSCWYRADGQSQQYYRLPVESDGRETAAVAEDAYEAMQQSVANIRAGTDDDPVLLSSGGMDSALLAGMFSQQTDPTTVTFGWEPDHFEDGRRLAETLGIDHEELHLDYHIPTQEELYFLEEPHSLGLNFPTQALSEAGYGSVVSGILAPASFPVGVSRTRKLRYAERMRPAMQLAQETGLHRIVDAVGPLGPDYRTGIEAVADDHDSGLYVAQNSLSVTDDESQRWITEQPDEDRLQQIEDRWYRPAWYDAPLDQRVHLLQIRHRDTRRYSHVFNQIQHHDPFTQQHLIDDQLQAPLDARRHRQAMHRILDQRFPALDPDPVPSGYSGFMDIFWNHMQAEPDRYQELVDSFLERGWLDPEPVRRRVIDPTDYRYERYGGNLVFLEQWLRTFIDRDEPWTQL